MRFFAVSSCISATMYCVFKLYCSPWLLYNWCSFQLLAKFSCSVFMKALESSSKNIIDIAQCFVHHVSTILPLKFDMRSPVDKICFNKLVANSGRRRQNYYTKLKLKMSKCWTFLQILMATCKCIRCSARTVIDVNVKWSNCISITILRSLRILYVQWNLNVLALFQGFILRYLLSVKGLCGCIVSGCRHFWVCAALLIKIPWAEKHVLCRRGYSRFSVKCKYVFFYPWLACRIVPLSVKALC